MSALEDAEAKIAARQEHIARILKDWPPMTPQQAKTVAGLLYGKSHVPPPGPSAYELEQRRKNNEREAALKRAQKLAESMTACDVCNLQPDQHKYAQRSGIGSHEWTPGRAEKILKRKARK